MITYQPQYLEPPEGEHFKLLEDTAAEIEHRLQWLRTQTDEPDFKLDEDDNVTVELGTSNGCYINIEWNGFKVTTYSAEANAKEHCGDFFEAIIHLFTIASML